MSQLVPFSASDLATLVSNVTSHTRPTTTAEILEALNYGQDKAVKAILSVRSQFFVSWVDPFTISQGVQEYDLSGYDPPLWRPTRLLVDGNSGTQAVIFRYRAMQDQDFEAREMSRQGTFSSFLYDILEGMLPGTATTSTAASASTVTVANVSGFARGQLIQVLGSGPLQAVAGTVTTVPTTYYGIVTGIAGSVLTVAPNFTANPPNGTTVLPMRRRLMRLVPPPGSTLTGRLYYQFRPIKLVNLNDVVDPIISDHRDMVVFYALSHLLRAVNDAEANSWFQEAQQLRSELMQDLEPLSGQASEALGSDLNSLD